MAIHRTPGPRPPMEELDVPLFDTWPISGGGRFAYFQSPRYGKTHDEFTNVETAGALSWPRSFDVRGIELSFAREVDVDGLKTEFWIGEERVFAETLQGRGAFRTWPLLVNIPTVQNFRFVIDASGSTIEPVLVRCSLLGTLHREKRSA